MTPLPRDASEHQHQVALFDWAEMMSRVHPDLGLLYAIPNAAKRSARHGKRMKDEGLRPGMPDICLPVARGDYSALYIELKARGGRLRDSQRDRLRELFDAGNAAWVAIGWEQAADLLVKYLRESLEGAGGW
jgi:hypothetical protein